MSLSEGQKTQQGTGGDERDANADGPRKPAGCFRQLGNLLCRVRLSWRYILRDEFWRDCDNFVNDDFLTRWLLRRHRRLLQGHHLRLGGRLRGQLCVRLQIRGHRRHGLMDDRCELHRARLRIYELLAVFVTRIEPRFNSRR